MKLELAKILANMKQYNSGDMIHETFGFDRKTLYDALVIAPGWKPTKIIKDAAYQVTQLTQHSYFSGYLVEKDGLKVAWAQVASGACNVLDHSIILAELQFRHLIFVGAVGSLVPEFEVGAFCTPSETQHSMASAAFLAASEKASASALRMTPSTQSAMS